MVEFVDFHILGRWTDDFNLSTSDSTRLRWYPLIRIQIDGADLNLKFLLAQEYKQCMLPRPPPKSHGHNDPQ